MAEETLLAAQASARIKLCQLRKERDKLISYYGEVEAKAEAASSDAERLQILAVGMKEATHHSSLMEDTRNLESMMFEASVGTLSEEGVRVWIERLQKNIAQARKRADTALLYSALLEEWAAAALGGGDRDRDPALVPLVDPPEGEEGEELRRAHAVLQQLALPADVAAADIAIILAETFHSCPVEFEQLKGRVQTFCKEQKAVTTSEVSVAIKAICNDNLLPRARQGAIRALAENELLLNEYAGVVTVMMQDMDEWAWPSEGAGLRIVRNKSGKLRPFLTEDTLTCIFLQVMGTRLSVRMRQELLRFCSAAMLKTDPATPNKALKALVHSFNSLLACERRYFLGSLFLTSLPENVPDSALSGAYKTPAKQTMLQFVATHTALLQVEGDHTAEAKQAASAATPSQTPQGPPGSQPSVFYFKGSPGAPSDDGDDEEYESHGDVSNLAPKRKMSVGAGQPAPTEPADLLGHVYAVSLDVENFYPSLSHGLLLVLLKEMNFSPKWIAFIQRFLEVPIACPGEATRICKRGVPLAHSMSRALSELVLFLVEFQVRMRTVPQPKHEQYGGIWLARVVDDMIILDRDVERAVNAVSNMRAVLQLYGLRLNDGKCGTVVISRGAGPEDPPSAAPPALPIPAGLPRGEIHWGLLQLCSDGRWRPDPALLEKCHSDYLERLSRAPTVMSMVQAYNSYTTFLTRRMFEPCGALGEFHLNEIAKVLAHVHVTLGSGILTRLRAAIYERFGKLLGAVGLPDAWFYWPITAGGLGLQNPLVRLGAFAKVLRPSLMDTDEERAAPRRFLHSELQALPLYAIQDTQGRSTFMKVHTYMMKTMEPPKPEKSAALEGMIEAFVDRGLRVRFGDEKKNTNKGNKFGVKKTGGKGIGMASQWLIATYHEQILAAFSSFALFNPEYVPLSLILQCKSNLGSE